MGDATALRAGDALIVVDVQNDFLPGGALAVEGGDEVVPVLNRYAELFASHILPVVATKDWHPETHCSFNDHGGPWPRHCIAGTRGASFSPQLQLPEKAKVIAKATRIDRDAYSGFEGTELDEWLSKRSVKRLFIGGLATDYCVLNTVRDALNAGYEVMLLLDGIRAVNVHSGDGEKAIAQMVKSGAQALRYQQLTENGLIQASA